MDPRYGWQPQGYPNGQYNPYAPPPQQPQQQQPNVYQQHGYPQYPPMQMQAPQGYPQSQPQQYQLPPQPSMPRPMSQQYAPMPPQMQPPQQPQYQRQPQVVIPPRTQQYAPMPQMQPPRIRHVQVPVQRTGSTGIAQTDGSGDQQRRYSAQQAPTTPSSKPVQRSPSFQENGPRPQQRPVVTPSHSQAQSRAPLQLQTTPQQQRVPSQSTPQQQYMSSQTTPQQQRPLQSTPQQQRPPQSTPQLQRPPQSQSTPQQQRIPSQPTLQEQRPTSQSTPQQPRPPQSTPQQQRPLQSTPQQQRVPPQSRTPSSQYGSPFPQPPSSKPRMHPQVVIPKASSLHQLTPTKRAHPPQKALPAELSELLLTAADEYIAVARGMGSLLIRERREADVRQYYKLMSTAMGCMDTVLKDFNMPPRDEAKLRLRYASLMIEETDIEAADISSRIEEILSKQISLCGRHRLQDLKFAALHLQARYQFKTNHRAGLKSLDQPIKEAETFQHIAWVYALRFLKVTLALQIPGRVEVALALQQLHAIQDHADRRGDRAIYVACHVLEAMVHLRSGASDRLEQAQRAIAAARSLQLQVSAKQLGSFGTLIDIIDIASGIQKGSPNPQKSTALLESILGDKDEQGSSQSGVFTVLIERSFGGHLTFDTAGIFRKNAEQKDELVFAWLPKEDLQALCFHICALDQHVHEKGLNFMKEAHQRFRETAKRRVYSGVPIPIAFARIEWNMVLDWYSMFAIGLMARTRNDSATADDALGFLKKKISTTPYNNQEAFARTLAYFSAITDQINGSHTSSLAALSSDVLAIPEKGHATPAKTDIAIMAALNRLLILRDASHPQHFQAALLLAQIKPLCDDHPNQYIRIAFRLVQAYHSEDAPILQQKKTVQAAVGMAQDVSKRTQNFEFVAMMMCYFVARFFAETVGEKSIQAIRAARSQAVKVHRPLWVAVVAGLCMNTYRRNGLVAEADLAAREFENVRGQLPVALRGVDCGGGDVDADGDVDAEGEEDVDADGDIDVVG
ncbi:hypothetical protein J4E83_008766 [Alternaria metachromatica]|uniref:uncharacterized protein n=1 Tax=Alternaria metachromatica TaxID=283354 RepID=UPI0020C23B03|nr:uncharacterized protein J4E83_008766 [Alternaria metachromatica]KAI4609125.1 hypothetical protein J4E83_008766 [Alternaria metachromatica]